MNGKDSMGDRVTRPLLPNMAENTAHTEGGPGPAPGPDPGPGLGPGVHPTDTEPWRTREASHSTLISEACH